MCPPMPGTDRSYDHLDAGKTVKTVDVLSRRIAERFPGPVAECVGLGLLEWDGERLRLTESGRLLGNEAFGRFVAAAAASP